MPSAGLRGQAQGGGERQQGDDGAQWQVETPGHEDIMHQLGATVTRASSSLVYYVEAC